MAVKKKSAKSEFFLLDALQDLCGEKEISPDILFEAIESALIFAYKKSKGTDRNVTVDLDRANGIFHIYELREVVEEITDAAKEISLPDAKKLSPNYEIGDIVRIEVSPAEFGRIAAQAAKQFVMQKIREAERGIIYDEYNERENDIVSGTVTSVEEGNLIVDIGKAEALLPPSEQMPADRYAVGDRVKAYVAEVRRVGKGPQIYLSRTHPGFLRCLVEREVPEVQEGILEIKSIAREAGARSKIAVVSSDEDIEPVGTCVGQHGVRIQAIIDELGGEKIDVVQWSEDPAQFIAAALSPAKVIKVGVSETEKHSRVVVPDNQLSLAIGKEGQNARLAARLTGWKIDIKSRTQTQDSPFPENMEVTSLIKKVRRKRKKKLPEEIAPEVAEEISEEVG